MKIELATVAFSLDLGLLRMQARSLSRYFNPADLGAIHIIINDQAPGRARAAIEKNVFPEFDSAQSLSSLVKVIDGRALWPAPSGTSGWTWQQIMKLRVADFVETPFYVALDAKNHFLRPVGLSAFVTAEGKATTYLSRKYGENRCWAIASYAAFGFEPEEIPERTMPTITPHTLETALVKDMIAALEARGEPIEVLLARHESAWTEFFLYQAYLLRRFGSFEARCAPLARDNGIILFPGWPTNEKQFEGEIALALTDQVLSFGLHRGRLPKLSPAQRESIRDLWLARGLIGADEDISWILPKPRRITPKRRSGPAETGTNKLGPRTGRR